jgi:hypothetical protein
MKSILLLIVACVLINMVTCIPSASEVRESIEAMKKVIEIKKVERENAEKIELASKYSQYCLFDKERKDRSEVIAHDIVKNLAKGEISTVVQSVLFDDSICVFIILVSSNFTVEYYMQDEVMFVSVNDIYSNVSSYFITHQANGIVMRGTDGTNYQSIIRYYVNYDHNGYKLLKYYFGHYDYNLGVSSSTNFIARQFNRMAENISGGGYYQHRVYTEEVHMVNL